MPEQDLSKYNKIALTGQACTSNSFVRCAPFWAWDLSRSLRAALISNFSRQMHFLDAYPPSDVNFLRFATRCPTLQRISGPCSIQHNVPLQMANRGARIFDSG